jgi:hypothetical protein
VYSFIKTVTFDCADALVTARFWAAALGSNVDEDSTSDKAYVEAAGWGGPNMWFNRVPEQKTAKNRIHFDLRAPGAVAAADCSTSDRRRTSTTSGNAVTPLSTSPTTKISSHARIAFMIENLEHMCPAEPPRAQHLHKRVSD